MAIAILLLIYAALTALAALMTDICLRRWKRTANGARRLRPFWLVPCVLLALLPVAGAFLPDSGAKFFLQAAGNIYLGFFLYYGFLLLMGFVLMGLARLLSRGRLGRAWHGFMLCASLAAALLIGAYGLHHAQDTVVERYEVSVDKPAGDLEELNVVLIADLHLSVNSRLAATQRMVELVNAQQPDVVVVAGDIFTSSYRGLNDPEAYAQALRGIEAKYGVYAVYGNHDVEETLFGGFPISPVEQAFRTAEMEAFFEDCGFTVLYDEVVPLTDGVLLAGRVDGEKAGDGNEDRLSAAELLSGADTDKPILVLEHEPREFQALAEAGADVALCGHTHAGQMFPGNLVVPFFNENAWGYRKIHDLETVVTAGVGYYGPPMRVGTDSEVSVVHITFGK